MQSISSLAYYWPYILIAVLLPQTQAQGNWGNDKSRTDTWSARSNSRVDITTQGIIAMCIIAGVGSITGVASGVLYLVAKKRQWAMSETIWRSARRVSRIIWITTPSSPRMSKAIPVN